MTIHLDPKLLKVIALWRSTTHAGEKAAAQARAEAMAAAAGITLDEAVAAADAPASGFTNIFSGFYDHMERQEPGWKARRAEEQAARRRENAKKRAAVIAKYGSEELALAPCDREMLILAAVAPWRTVLRKAQEPNGSGSLSISRRCARLQVPDWLLVAA